MIIEDNVKKYIKLLCDNAGESEAFFDDFLKRLSENEDIYDEFLVFAKTGNFDGKVVVNGYSIIDILVWQIDHFKAFLDRADTIKENPSKMAVNAFMNFLKMKENPEEYLKKMGEESGSDYDGKF